MPLLALGVLVTAPLTSMLSTHLSSFTAGQPWSVGRAIREVVLGLAMGDQPMLSVVGRALDEHRPSDGEPRDLIHTVRRLSRQLRSDRFDDAALERALLEHVRPLACASDGEGLTIAVDRTDIAHPYARPDRPAGMEHVCVCFDGSRKQRTVGYPLVQIEATNGELSVPVLYRLFSYNAPDYVEGDEPSVFLRAVGDAQPYVGSLATWVFDRGFDATVYFAGLDRLGLRWVIRLKDRSRKVLDKRGRIEWARDAAEATQTPFALHLRSADGRKETLAVGGRAVRLLGPDGHPEAKERTLLVVRLPAAAGQRRQMHLLADRVLGTKKEKLDAVRHYLRRWDVEESTRWAKDSRGWGFRLEDIRLLSFRGIQRMIWMILIAYLFTIRLRLGAGRLIEKLHLLTRVKAFRDIPADPRYRLLAGIRDALRRAPRWAIERWLTQG